MNERIYLDWNATAPLRKEARAAALAALGLVGNPSSVQAEGRIPCDINALGADFLTLSGHKIGAPKGVGALVGRNAVALDPLVKGGGQERGLRGGTENVAAIAGFGAAAATARAELASERTAMAALRERLEARLKAASPEMVIFGAQSQRPSNTTLFAGAGMEAE